MGLLQPHGRYGCGDGRALSARRFHDAASLATLLDRGGGPALSAPGLVAFAGPAFLLACAGAAGATPEDIILDCGAETGRALEAVRLGARHVALDAGAPGRVRAHALMAASGARLHLP